MEKMELCKNELKNLIEKGDVTFSIKNDITKYNCDGSKLHVRRFLKQLEGFKVFNWFEEMELFVNTNGEVLAIAIGNKYKRYRIITSSGNFDRNYANQYINLNFSNWTDSYISVEVCNLNHNIKKIKLGEPLAIIK